MPKLSVIVPVYNTEKYLRECIDSILAQTFTDFELILADDGSTDQSGSICDEYAQKDNRIIVAHQKNAGVTAARKRGVNIASGEYVTFVDSDDWIDRDAYFRIWSALEENNAEVGVFAMVAEKDSPAVIRNYVGEGSFSKEMLQQTVYPKLLFDYSLNRAGIIPSLCNKVMKRELLVKAIEVIPDELDYGEDAISGYLCILNANTVWITNTPFYHYRDNPSSISHAGSSTMKKRILALDREMRKLLAGYGADLPTQIDGHIARHTVEQVRADLICLTDMSFSRRCCAVRGFCEQPQIVSALKGAAPYIQNQKEKIKVLLIRCRLFALLYWLINKV